MSDPTLPINPKTGNYPIADWEKTGGNLTLPQIDYLATWARRQKAGLFDGWSIQQILSIWHAAKSWRSYEAWFAAEPEKAERAYEARARGMGWQRQPLRTFKEAMADKSVI